MKSYSQLRAMMAITKASLRALFRSPSSVIFGFAFPFIFILVFGFMGNGSLMKSYKVAIDNTADTANQLFLAFKNTPGLTLKKYADNKSLEYDLQHGKIAGVINIQKNPSLAPPYIFTLKSTTSSNDQWPQFKALAETVINKVSNEKFPDRPAYAEFNFDFTKDIRVIRQYTAIEFILPGQLGFYL